MNQSKKRLNRAVLLAVLIALALGAVIGTTVAFLIDKPDAVTNSFTYAHVSCQVTESFDDTTKKDVKIQNTSDINVYIRATYVVNWLDENGNVAASVPEGYSYTLTENPNGAWTKTGDYFYYLTPVAPNASTDGSLLNCTVTCPEDPVYTLSVKIIATAIQSEPASAVTEAWGVSPSGN